MSKLDKKFCPCTFCEKTFRASTNLNDHIRTHTGEKQFKCVYCQRMFNKRFNMKVHVGRIHTGERPFKCRKFKCEVCDYATHCSTSMGIHTRRHTGEKPFCCQYCEKSFAIKQCWKQHERIHTGEKPYSCRFCQKTFRTSGMTGRFRLIARDMVWPFLKYFVKFKMYFRKPPFLNCTQCIVCTTHCVLSTL